MRVGFEEYDEWDQEKKKRLWKLDSKMTRVEIGFLGLIFLLFVLGTVYYGYRTVVYGDGLEPLKICAFLMIATLLLALCGYLLMKTIIRMQKRMSGTGSLPFRLANPDKRTLDGVLNYLRVVNPIMLVWDIPMGLLALVCLIPMGRLTRDTIMTRATFVAVFLAGHFIVWLICRKFSYKKRLLKCTKNYRVIDNSEMFFGTLENSLKTELLHCSRYFVITGSYLMGHTDNGLFFYPVAIPRAEIVRAEFYLEKYYGVNTRQTMGILSCELTSRRVVKFYTAPNTGVNVVLQALNDSGFSYKINNTDIYKY